MQAHETDILIVGGGLVGLSLAKGLEDLNIPYLLLDEHLDTGQGQTRPLALSRSSQAILNYLGVWDAIAPTCSPITNIHVSSEGAFGQLNFEPESKRQKIGVVADLIGLQVALKQSLKQQSTLIKGRFIGLEHLDGSHQVHAEIAQKPATIEAKWVIAADGAMSAVRQACRLPVELAEEQIAYLGRIKLKTPHQGLAYERFTDWGPLALLPWGTHEMAMVWSCPKPHQLPEISEGFKKQLGSRLGHFDWLGPIKSYPLKQSFMPKQLYHHILFLGNAAHSLHPVAGQGFNLSLRDVVVLLDLIKHQGMSIEMLAQYLLARGKDQRVIQKATAFLSGQFSLIPKVMKGLGLLAMGEMSSLRALFESYAQGLYYELPEEIYAFLEEIHD
jgi:2-octaprenyl-6-methoxyphenol hydroxylase